MLWLWMWDGTTGRVACRACRADHCHYQELFSLYSSKAYGKRCQFQQHKRSGEWVITGIVCSPEFAIFIIIRVCFFAVCVRVWAGQVVFLLRSLDFGCFSVNILNFLKQYNFYFVCLHCNTFCAANHAMHMTPFQLAQSCQHIEPSRNGPGLTLVADELVICFIQMCSIFLP